MSGGFVRVVARDLRLARAPGRRGDLEAHVNTSKAANEMP